MSEEYTRQNEAEADYYADLAEKAEYEEQMSREAAYQAEITNEVEEAKFDAWLELNKSSLEKEFVEDHKDDFMDFCKATYNEFKED